MATCRSIIAVFLLVVVIGGAGCQSTHDGDLPTMMPADTAAIERITIRLHTDVPVQVRVDRLPITAIPATDATYERRLTEPEQYQGASSGWEGTSTIELTDIQDRSSRSLLHLGVGPGSAASAIRR